MKLANLILILLTRSQKKSRKNLTNVGGIFHSLKLDLRKLKGADLNYYPDQAMLLTIKIKRVCMQTMLSTDVKRGGDSKF